MIPPGKNQQKPDGPLYAVVGGGFTTCMVIAIGFVLIRSGRPPKDGPPPEDADDYQPPNSPWE